MLAAVLLAIAAVAGSASGEFKAGTRPPIQPKYAAAYETRDQRDARKTAIEVVLSDAPVDVAAAVDALDPHTVVINDPALKDHNYVLLWVRPGNDVSMNATYSETMTQFIDMTPTLSAEIGANTAEKVAGHVFTPKPVKTMDGEVYSADLTFSAPVTHAAAGTRLAAGGGEPGTALKALLAAVASKNWPGIQRNVSARNREMFDGAADAIRFLGISLPKKAAKITGGILRGDAATLEVESELYEGQKGLYLVRMIRVDGKWVYERAVTAGLVGK